MSTKPTTSETFAEYAARLGVDEHHPMHDNALRMWEMEREAERTYPTVVPACPDWCEEPGGHEYDSYLRGDEGGVEHYRTHVRTIGTAGVLSSAGTINRVVVMSTETYTDGAVSIDPPEVDVPDYRGETLPAADARTLAADLLAAADLLDRLAQ